MDSQGRKRKSGKMTVLRGEKILIGPSTFSEADSSPLERLRRAGCEIIVNPFGRKLTKAELCELLAKGITGLIAGLEPLEEDVLERSRLRVISRCGAGLSNIDLKAAGKLKIKVYATPDAPTLAVAELTVGAMLCLIRMLPEMDRELHLGNWTKKIGAQLKRKKVAIIGFGRIGRKVAELLGPFEADIIVVDPKPDKAAKKYKLLPLRNALKTADIVTIHASGDSAIIGKEELKLVKRGSYLLNAARGALVEEKALVSALEDGRIKAAWLDTFETEPYSGPLRKYPQVILTPHIGSYTAECRKDMEMEAVNNLINGFKA